MVFSEDRLVFSNTRGKATFTNKGGSRDLGIQGCQFHLCSTGCLYSKFQGLIHSHWMPCLSRELLDEIVSSAIAVTQ